MASNSIIEAGPFRFRLGEVAAYFYRFRAEPEPAPVMVDVLDRDGNPTGETVESPDSVAAYNAWAARRPNSDGNVSLERTRAFLVAFGCLFERLAGITDEEAIQFEFYEAAKAAFGQDKADIREFFVYGYLLVNQTPNGSRWGQYVMMLGLEQMIEIIRGRFYASALVQIAKENQ